MHRVIASENIAASISAAQAEVFPLERNFARDEIAMSGSLDRLDAARRTLRTARQTRQGSRLLYRSREAAAMLVTARWVYASALERRETRGIHRRRDFPALDQAPPQRLEVRGLDSITVKQAP